jgi:hypothetical protein
VLERNHFGDRLGWWIDIKMVLKEIGCDGLDWIERAQERDEWRVLVNMAMNLQATLKAGNFLTS